MRLYVPFKVSNDLMRELQMCFSCRKRVSGLISEQDAGDEALADLVSAPGKELIFVTDGAEASNFNVLKFDTCLNKQLLVCLPKIEMRFQNFG